MECILAGETEVLGENLPQRHFCPSQNPTWPNSVLNPGRRGGKPATNRLSYGAALLVQTNPVHISVTGLSNVAAWFISSLCVKVVFFLCMYRSSSVYDIYLWVDVMQITRFSSGFTLSVVVSFAASKNSGSAMCGTRQKLAAESIISTWRSWDIKKEGLPTLESGTEKPHLIQFVTLLSNHLFTGPSQHSPVTLSMT
jgi:hypothetical protein